MRNSLENRMLVNMQSGAGDGCSVAESARVASTHVHANICSDGKPATIDELAADDTAMTEALAHAESMSHTISSTTGGTGSSSFPMTGAGLANVHNEL